MKTPLASVLFILCFIGPASAQQASASAGGDAAGSSGTVAYSVGQIDFQEQSTIGGSVYEGVQQPYEIFTVGMFEDPLKSFSLSVFPNPATSFITLHLEGYRDKGFYCRVYDLYGRLISGQDIYPGETNISLLNLQPATYLLKVSGDSGMQILKIIKN